MSKKKSFFERLTGGISLADDEAVSVTPEHEKSDINDSENNNWLKEEAEVGELAVDVYQTSTEIIIKALVAGVKGDEIEISANRETVSITGKRQPTHEARDDDYFIRELYWGAFSRTIVLPCEVESGEVDATSDKTGLLTLRLTKIDKKKIQKIKVKSV